MRSNANLQIKYQLWTKLIISPQCCDEGL